MFGPFLVLSSSPLAWIVNLSLSLFFPDKTKLPPVERVVLLTLFLDSSFASERYFTRSRYLVLGPGI